MKSLILSLVLFNIFTKVVSQALTKEWATPKLACIYGHNAKIYFNVRNLRKCQLKCEALSYCKSIEYNRRIRRCQLSRETSLTSKKSYKVPCHYDPKNYYFTEIKPKALTKEWTKRIFACIYHHNDKEIQNIRSFEDCQHKCEAAKYCNSIEYNKKTRKCLLTRETSSTVAKGDYHKPCYHDSKNYLYAEIKPKALTRPWTKQILACIGGAVKTFIYDVRNFIDCQHKCEAEPSCKSVEYKKRMLVCLLSKETTSSASEYYEEPCDKHSENTFFAEIKASTIRWAPPKLACIRGHNDKSLENIQNLKDCEFKCEAEPYCNSVEYNEMNRRCQLTRETSSSVPNDFKEPCHVNPMTYRHSEIVPKVLTMPWTRQKSACYHGVIPPNNINNIRNFNECQRKCEQETYCNSIVYNKKTLRCLMTRETSSTIPNNYQEPCKSPDLSYAEIEQKLLTDEWTDEILACITLKHSTEINIARNFKECQYKCEAKSFCKSIVYNKKDQGCYLMKDTSSTVPRDYSEPCKTTTHPEDYLYAEIIEQCGISKVIQKRIIGGQDADVGEYPWQVWYANVEFTPTGENFTICGGNLIHKKWVLTAAHCIKDEIVHNRVELGEHVRQIRGDGTQLAQVKKIILHESFNKPHSFSYDFALLELETEVEITDRVRTICLPKKYQQSENHFDNDECYITGWGKMQNDNPKIPKHGTLQEATVRVYTKEECLNDRGNNRIDDSIFCAGYRRGGKDTCKGDSGGPLQCKDGNRWILWGVTSFGKRPCASPGKASGYGRVTHVLDWIEEKTGITF
eukprot:TCONS_00064566-protein